VAVELRHRKIRGSLAQDLVGPPQLLDLSLQQLEAFQVIGGLRRWSRSSTIRTARSRNSGENVFLERSSQLLLSQIGASGKPETLQSLQLVRSPYNIAEHLLKRARLLPPGQERKLLRDTFRTFRGKTRLFGRLEPRGLGAAQAAARPALSVRKRSWIDGLVLVGRSLIISDDQHFEMMQARGGPNFARHRKSSADLPQIRSYCAHCAGERRRTFKGSGERGSEICPPEKVRLRHAEAPAKEAQPRSFSLP
jgi:hypothetical protein